MIRLSLVICFRPDRYNVKPLFESLSTQKIKEHAKFIELILVHDQAPLLDPKNFRALDREDQTSFSSRSCNFQVAHIRQSTSNVARARNQGAIRAQGEWIGFLDADVVLPDSRWMQRVLDLVQVVCEDREILGGYYLNEVEACRWVRALNRISNWWADHYDGVLGGVVFVPKAIINHCLFDEHLGFGGEETGLLSLARQKKIKISRRHELSVVHRPNISLAAILRKAWREGNAKSQISKALQNQNLTAGPKKKAGHAHLFLGPLLETGFIVCFLALVRVSHIFHSLTKRIKTKTPAM